MPISQDPKYQEYFDLLASQTATKEEVVAKMKKAHLPPEVLDLDPNTLVSGGPAGPACPDDLLWLFAKVSRSPQPQILDLTKRWLDC